ncbi:hypothetical protein BD626DRAFT_544765 [Schizophyllum amplum]|uniref:Fungal-type protein kinase domain-containing protein n=1 Tax=Schizophyllum amplum TaxID=97359 RepID=A0A550D003_9AGAR|nr:hypothetical protein BD626DRAFT_544765 [Auriculariopsis ampla]
MSPAIASSPSTSRRTPEPSATTSFNVTDTPWTIGAGGSSYGHRTVTQHLQLRLRQELQNHHVDRVTPLKPDATQTAAIQSFLRKTSLYDDEKHRWRDIPAAVQNERELYDPQAAIFRTILQHFEIKDRRFMLTWNNKVKHAPHVDEQLSTSPDYSVVGRGPLINGDDPFPSSSTELPDEWANYDLLTTVGDAKKDVSCSPFKDGIQLSVYARQCFIQQHNREFVPAYIITEKNFRYYRFDRCGMMSTVEVNYHEDPITFVHLFRLICSDDAPSIGYNPTLYFKNKGKQRTRFYKSTLRRVLDNIPADLLPPNAVPVEIPVDVEDGLGVVKDRRLWVTEELEIRVHNKPLHFRRGLRGRGGVYWAGEHATLGKVIVKQSYRPSGRVPEWKYLLAAVGVKGVGQMLAFDTRAWRVSESRGPGGTGDGTKFHDREWSSIVLRRYGDSIDHFKDQRQILTTFRDAIKGHQNLWDKDILHRDVSISNILMGDEDAEDGWKGVIIDLDMAISLNRQSSNVGVDFRTGTRAYQSLHVLNSYGYKLPDPNAQTVPPDSQRLMHDYLDDLESFYWCLCWICFTYDGPGQPNRSATLAKWENHDPETAYDAKFKHLAVSFNKDDVKPWFRRFVPLLQNLHDFCLENFNGRQALVKKKKAHTRDVSVMRKDSKERYDFVLHAIQTTIDDLEAGAAFLGSDDEDDVDVGGGELPSLSVELLKPQRALPYSNSSGTKRKSQEELDESPTKKNRGPARPSSLRHSGESHDA